MTIICKIQTVLPQNLGFFWIGSGTIFNLSDVNKKHKASNQ